MALVNGSQNDQAQSELESQVSEWIQKMLQLQPSWIDPCNPSR